MPGLPSSPVATSPGFVKQFEMSVPVGGRQGDTAARSSLGRLSCFSLSSFVPAVAARPSAPAPAAAFPEQSSSLLAEAGREQPSLESAEPSPSTGASFGSRSTSAIPPAVRARPTPGRVARRFTAPDPLASSSPALASLWPEGGWGAFSSTQPKTTPATSPSLSDHPPPSSSADTSRRPALFTKTYFALFVGEIQFPVAFLAPRHRR